jgi:hypothetical protein
MTCRVPHLRPTRAMRPMSALTLCLARVGDREIEIQRIGSILTKVNTGQTRPGHCLFAIKPLRFLDLQIGPPTVEVSLRFTPFLSVLALNL